MEKKSAGPIAIGEILGQRVIGPPEGSQGQAQGVVLPLLDLVEKWPDVVGSLIAEKAHPMRLTGGTLFLQTVSTMWANELQLMVPRLIEEIGEQCPQLKVQKIRFIS